MKLKSAALLVASSMVAGSAIAADRVEIKHEQNPAYVWDSYGEIVRDNYGACVRTIDWKEDIEACGGKPKVEEVVVVEEVKAAPAPVAKAEPKPEPKAEPAKEESKSVAAPVAAAAVATAVVVSEDKPAAFSGLFENNSFDLKPEAREKLDAYADYMKRKPETSIQVNGYTDDRGKASYNQMLSEKRANAVKAYLEEQGVDSSRIAAKGMGEANPIADNATKAGRAENRRVELVVE